MFRVKFRVMYKNGRIESYKSGRVPLKDARRTRDNFKGYFKVYFNGNEDAHVIVKDTVIRVKDISSIEITVGL